jgi:hypothetical protein
MQGSGTSMSVGSQVIRPQGIDNDKGDVLGCPGRVFFTFTADRLKKQQSRRQENNGPPPRP